MNLPSITLWGLEATVALTTMIIAGQSLGLTRLDMPFILGTIFTPDRDRAKIVGYLAHVVNGWLLALIYAAFFENLRLATWWFGGLIGVVQGIVVVSVVFPLLPGVHPRMVSDFRGSEPTRLLEPPGSFCTNYGRITPLIIVIAHAIYGLSGMVKLWHEDNH